jgi:hypothetical protein
MIIYFKNASLLSVIIVFLFFTACKNEDPDPKDPIITDTTQVVEGIGLLSKIPGIWNGPVTSTTSLGNYTEWILDFRPISTSQVSAKSELDSLNDILMSFFVVKHNGELNLAFRNGGSFAGYHRIAYAVLDSVSETTESSYYRFSDFVADTKRAYTQIIFRNDSMLMSVYTNKYNTLSTAQLHMSWTAKLMDTTSVQTSLNQFTYPSQSNPVDFSTVFDGKTEAIYYDLSVDPYPDDQQPYLGSTTVNLNFSSSLSYTAGAKIYLVITTQSLFSGYIYNAANLKYRSRYVILSYPHASFTFTLMHPGQYYIYPFYDKNNDGAFLSGDYMSSDFTNSFTVAEKANTTVSSTIDFTIP